MLGCLFDPKPNFSDLMLTLMQLMNDRKYPVIGGLQPHSPAQTIPDMSGITGSFARNNTGFFPYQVQILSVSNHLKLL
jgi:hypothetical protein